jgi:DNA polymerase-3 subunit beta
MQAVVPRAALVEALRIAEPLLPFRSPEPLLEHVLLQAGPHGCTLLAFDPEVALWLAIPAEVGQPGQALLPGRRLLALVRQADAEALRLERAGDAVLLTAPGLTYELVGGDPARFPDPGPLPPRAHALLPAEPLARAVRRTAFATASGPGHYRDYLLEAVLCESGPDTLRLVASDNRRLAVAEVPLPDQGAVRLERRLLLSVRALGLLARLAQGQEEPVRAFFGPPQAFFRVGGATLAARLLSGRFPDWRAALPDELGPGVEVPVGALLAGVRQAAVLREPAYARLLIRLEPGRLVLESRQAGAGSVAVEVAVGYGGEPKATEFNPAYLLQLLRALEGEEAVRVEVGKPGDAAVFTAAGGYRHVVMTLRPVSPSPDAVFSPGRGPVDESMVECAR